MILPNIIEANMPLTPKGEKIEHAMEKEYGEKKGKEVFYASKNKGTIKGVERKKRDIARHMQSHPVKSHYSGKYYQA